MKGFRIQRWIEEGTRDATEGEAGTAATEASEPEPLAPGPAVDFDQRFVCREEIGRGGMGSVHRIIDRELWRELAVKVLAAEKQAHVDRFLAEAQITSQLDHPNIVPIHDVGIDEQGIPYLSMKLVRGDTLADIIDRAGDERLHPARLERLLQVLIKVCEAVSFAHSRGVVHRDVKPSNIMVGPFGEVYLMDWGVACLLPAESCPEPARRIRIARHFEEPEGAVGTVSYMSPEQATGPSCTTDARTDVFLLGATLYQILTGRPPYDQGTMVALLVKAMKGEFPPPAEVAGAAVPARLAQIALRAMAVDPAERYATAGDFQGALETFLRGAWHLPVERFAAGELIVREGEPANTAYILVDGRCSVYKGSGADKVVLRSMGPGDAFGETAVVSDKPRTATVEALDEVKVMVVTREILSEELGLSSWMGRFVVALAERFRDVDERLRGLERELGR